jgi:hypothetical protein
MTDFKIRFKSIETAYETCATHLGSKNIVKIDHGFTTLRREGSRYIIKQHDTDIMVITPKSITIDVGPWTTFTTKERLNGILPSSIRTYQAKGQWYMTSGGDRTTYVFKNGITFHANGKVTGAAKPADTAKIVRLRKKIDKYATEFAKRAVEGKISAPSGGDCWYCAMRIVNEKQPLGEAINDTSHIEGHLKENYYVPSLLARAAEKQGGFVLNIGLPLLWDPTLDPDKRKELIDRNNHRGSLTRDLKKSLKKYIAFQLKAGAVR